MIQKINHIALVVEDMIAAQNFWVEVMGIPLKGEKHVAEQQVDVSFLPVGESDIELLQPTTDNSGVAKYIAKRGPGIHHICFEVDDIQDMMNRLAESGVQLIDAAPRVDDSGKQYAFVHPKSTGGVLVELYQLP